MEVRIVPRPAGVFPGAARVSDTVRSSRPPDPQADVGVCGFSLVDDHVGQIRYSQARNRWRR